MYTVTTDETSRPQVDALPPEALIPFAEARTVLEVAPWNGRPYHRSKPDSPVRTLSFGPDGQSGLVYLVLEDQRRVDLLLVVWMCGAPTPPAYRPGARPRAGGRPAVRRPRCTPDGGS